MKRFLVLHDYGMEGWKIVAQCDTILDAVMAREADVINAGGTSIIVELQPLLKAYQMAEYQQQEEQRAAERAKGKA